MTVISEHDYALRVLDAAADIALSLDEDNPGTISLDADDFPHVQGSLTVAVENALLLNQLDPRDSRRVVLEVNADLPSGPRARTFDLGIREASPDRAGGTVTLRLASDEALVMDYAQLVDDPTPRALQASLRDVCEYVLAKVPGVQRNLNPYPTAGAGSAWGAGSWGTGGAGTVDLAGSTGVNQQIPNAPQPAMSFTWTTAPTGGLPSFDTAVFAIPTGRPTMTFSGNVASTIAGAQWQLIVQWLSDSAFISSSTGAAAFPATVNGRYSVTARPPVGATRARITWRLTAGTVVVGSYGWVTLASAVVGLRTSYVGKVLEPGPDADVTAYWGVTNLFTNPSFENTTAGWANGSLATGLGATTGQKLFGAYAGWWQTTGSGQSFIDFNGPISVQAGRSYVFSQYMRASVARPGRVMIRFKNAAGVVLADRYSAAVGLSTTAWTRVSSIQVAPAGATQATAHVEYQASAAGQFVYVDGLMFHEGTEVVPYFDGDTADSTTYVYDWTNTAHVSTSTRTPTTERPPEALIWRAGVSAMAFLEPLLKASGLRIVCDEERRWSLRTAEYRADGTQSFRHAINVETADEQLSREDDAWFDAAVYEYIWTDKDGIEQRRVDAFALTATPTKVRRVELRDTVYPGPGRAAHIVRRAQGRGRTVTVSAIPTWTERTDQYLSVALEGTPIQTGIAGSVRYDFATDTVTVSSRTTDTAAGAIDLLAGTINALPGTINNL